jgi:hypothetical protein
MMLFCANDKRAAFHWLAYAKKNFKDFLEFAANFFHLLFSENVDEIHPCPTDIL